MREKSGLLHHKALLISLLAVVAVLIFVFSGESEAPMSGAITGPEARDSAAISNGGDTGQVGSAEIPDSPRVVSGPGDRAGSSAPGESVNPTIDRYGVPVSMSLPVISDASRDPQASNGGSPRNGIAGTGNMQSPEAGAVQNSGAPSQGPGASSAGSAGLPPEGLNPQMSGQAPEAFDPGLPMMPPEATDAGINGPGPGELEIGVTGPGPGEQENGTPTNPPDER